MKTSVLSCLAVIAIMAVAVFYAKEVSAECRFDVAYSLMGEPPNEIPPWIQKFKRWDIPPYCKVVE